jgi:hypothetical protein
MWNEIHDILNILNQLGKFEYIILLNSSFDVGLFFNFNFEITMTYFLSPQFLFYMRERCNINISKVHYGLILFLEFSWALNPKP